MSVLLGLLVINQSYKWKGTGMVQQYYCLVTIRRV